MEIVRYAIVGETGIVLACSSCEEAVLTSLYFKKGCTIVKLVGTMPEPKKMKKVALFAYRSQMGNLVVGDYLRTEEEAKLWCKDNRHTLLQWPHGSVIEIEE
jgi:hypothetical protein